MTVVNETTIDTVMNKMNISEDVQTQISGFIFVVPILIILLALIGFFIYAMYLVILYMKHGPTKILHKMNQTPDDIEAQNGNVSLEDKVKKLQASRSANDAEKLLKYPEPVYKLDYAHGALHNNNVEGYEADDSGDGDTLVGNDDKIEDDEKSKTIHGSSGLTHEYKDFGTALKFSQSFPLQYSLEPESRTWWCFKKENRWSCLTTEGLEEMWTGVKSSPKRAWGALIAVPKSVYGYFS